MGGLGQFWLSGRLCESPFTLRSPRFGCWSCSGQAMEQQPEPQLQVLPGAFLAPRRKLGLCGVCPAPQGALWGAGTVLGSEKGRWEAGAVWDGRAPLLRAGKAALSLPGVCAPLAEVAPAVLWPCCEHGSVSVLVLSNPLLSLCFPSLSFLCNRGI